MIPGWCWLAMLWSGVGFLLLALGPKRLEPDQGVGATLTPRATEASLLARQRRGALSAGRLGRIIPERERQLREIMRWPELKI